MAEALTMNDQESRIDPQLLPFLRTESEREAGEHLDSLMRRVAPEIARITRSSRAPEDAFQDVAHLVIKQLRELRARGNGSGISNYVHYVKVVASHVVKEQIRQEHPRHRSLVDALRHVLRREPAVASWENRGLKICGLVDWVGQPDVQSEEIKRLLENPLVFEEVVQSRCDAENVNLGELTRRLLQWIGHPVRFGDLVKIMCGLRRVKDLRPVGDGDETGMALSERLADNRPRPDDQAEWKEFLERLWSGIKDLPQQHRLAYLLNFTSADGQLELFSAYGVAGVRRIGAALEITEEQFARVWEHLPLNQEARGAIEGGSDYDVRFAVLWPHLPLADNTLARLLGTDRQKVINLRKTASDRLSRLMGRETNAKLD